MQNKEKEGKAKMKLRSVERRDISFYEKKDERVI